MAKVSPTGRAGILPKGDLRFAPVARPGDSRWALVRSVEP